jgi:hypothetical protein
MAGSGLRPVRELIERYLTLVQVDMSGPWRIEAVGTFEVLAGDFEELAALCRGAAGTLRREEDVPDTVCPQDGAAHADTA